MSKAPLQLATVVDWAALGETALAAIVAGTVFTLAFSLAIVGASRAIDYRREERRWEAVVAGLLGGVALVLSLGLVVFGLLVMVS